jgi:hypothetical protein
VIEISLAEPESHVLRHVLAEVAANYRLKPGQLDPKAIAVWYSTRGCESARMSQEETAAWLENLHAFRGGNLRRIEQWRRELSNARGNHYRLRLALGDAPVLLTVLNDHRLLTAARHGIGEGEMDFHSLEAFAAMTPEQQSALFEIHFLAWIMEEVLQLLPGSPGDWRTHAAV